MMLGINRAMRRVLTRYARSREGVTAIEFAMVATPFFFVLISLFELGIMLFAEYALAQNVEAAGRLIRTGQIQMKLNGHQNTQDYFRTSVCGKLNIILDCGSKLYVDVRKFSKFSDISGNLPSIFKTGTTELSDDITVNTKFDAGAAGEIVTVRVYYKWDLVSPGLGWLIGAAKRGFGNVSESGATDANSRLLSAAATFRNEPFSDGS